MTKKEILDLLSPFTLEQEVVVLVHSSLKPKGSILMVQNVVPLKGKQKDAPELIGLECHAANRSVPA